MMGSKQYSSTADQRRCLKLNVKLKPMHNKAKVWILKLEVQSPRWVVGEKSQADDPLPSFRSPIPNGEVKFDAERALFLTLRLTHTHFLAQCG